MVRGEQERLNVKDEVDLMQAVMQTGRVAQAAGFGEVDSAKMMTAVSELARNILKYAGRGMILLSRLQDMGRAGLEVVAEDRGPGIADVGLAMQDHYSTEGTLGLGLPGVRRMVDEFEIVSGRNEGTRVTIRKWR